MTTPTDPYSIGPVRVPEDNDMLAPIAPTPSAQSAFDDDFLGEVDAEVVSSTLGDAALPGMDPAFARLKEEREKHEQDTVNRTSESSEETPSENPATTSPAQAPSPASVEEDELTRTRSHISLTDVSLPRLSDVSRELNGEDSQPTNEQTQTPFSSTPTPASLDPQAVREAQTLWAQPQSTATFSEAHIERERGRGLAHTASFFLVAILMPLFWFIAFDALTRLQGDLSSTSNLSEASEFANRTLSLPGLGELVLTLVIAIALFFTARLSTFGQQLWGIVLTIFGFIPLVLPTIASHIIQAITPARNFSSLGESFVNYFTLSCANGLFVLYGFILFISAFAAHRIRKAGIVSGRRIHAYEAESAHITGR